MTYFQVMTYQMKTTGPIFSLFLYRTYICLQERMNYCLTRGPRHATQEHLRGRGEGIEIGFSSSKKIDVKLSTVADRSLGQRTDKYKIQTDKKCSDSADITCKKS